MELKEMVNLYERYQKKLNELWRSLWPWNKKEKYKKTRRRNVFSKLLEW